MSFISTELWTGNSNAKEDVRQCLKFNVKVYKYSGNSSPFNSNYYYSRQING